MDMTYWTVFKDSVTLIVAVTTAIFVIGTFRTNARSRRAEVLSKLHKDFFVDAGYKEMRAKLDDTSEVSRQRLDALSRMKNQSSRISSITLSSSLIFGPPRICLSKMLTLYSAIISTFSARVLQ